MKLHLRGDAPTKTDLRFLSHELLITAFAPTATARLLSENHLPNTVLCDLLIHLDNFTVPLYTRRENA